MVYTDISIRGNIMSYRTGQKVEDGTKRLIAQHFCRIMNLRAHLGYTFSLHDIVVLVIERVARAL